MWTPAVLFTENNRCPSWLTMRQKTEPLLSLSVGRLATPREIRSRSEPDRNRGHFRPSLRPRNLGDT